MRREDVVRKLIEAVLEQGLKFGLEAAGAGLMGPAWPAVRPLLEKLLGDLPKGIAERYRSSQEAVDQAAAALESRQAEIAVIASALDAHGMTQDWARALVESTDQLSDDMLALLHEQSAQGKTLDEVLALARTLVAETGARLL